MEMIAVLEVEGTLVVRTGLHIGGNSDGIHAALVDRPVARDPFSGLPFVPGSSVKGKLRSLLEWTRGKVSCERAGAGPCICNECDVCRIFGVPARIRATRGKIKGPTRLAVADAFPHDDTLRKLGRLETGLPFTEWKKENALDRITSSATPRDVERVPAGSRYGMKFTYTLYEPEDADALGELFAAMDLLEGSYLGGSGSRGYGRVKIAIDRIGLTERRNLVDPGGAQLELLAGVRCPAEVREKVAGAVRGALGLPPAPASPVLQASPDPLPEAPSAAAPDEASSPMEPQPSAFEEEAAGSPGSAVHPANPAPPEDEEDGT